MEADREVDVVPGTLDFLILKTLALEPMHGWGIGKRIEQVSGVFRIRLGSLYPALERLQEAGMIAASWKQSVNNRRARYYRFTAAGERRLNAEVRDWSARAAGILRVLEAT